jgi:hypothetical protein
MGTSGSCPTCGKRWGGTPKGHFGYVVTDCIECTMNKSKAWEKIGGKMIQESPKVKGIKKSRSGHPKVSIPKNSNPRTKRTAGNEPSQPLSKYTKLIKYKTY